MNQRGGRAGDREKESASDDLFICVFLEEQSGLFWFSLPGRNAGREKEAASPGPRPAVQAEALGVPERVRHTFPCQVTQTQSPEPAGATVGSPRGQRWHGAESCAVGGRSFSGQVGCETGRMGEDSRKAEGSSKDGGDELSFFPWRHLKSFPFPSA